MKIYKFLIILALGLTLCACGRSKQADFYLLNPIPPKMHPTHHYTDLKIGIDSIRTPAFTEKPQLLIYDGVNQVQLEEFHQWAESLDKNIKRVIKTNLYTLLPGIVIEDAPWNIDFKPNYTVQIDISEFKIDRFGNSSLRANYIVSYQGELIKNYSQFYHEKIPVVTIKTLVMSMNRNLNHLTHDMAQTFAALKNFKKINNSGRNS